MASCYEIKIITDFSAAHLIRDYDGVCNRLHGHNWKIEVVVKAKKLDSVGMGMDFKDVKAAANELIGKLDHRNLNEIAPFDEVNPTAENLAAYFYQTLSSNLNDERVKVDAITIWETERCCVTYSET